ncbi:MAG: LysR family transcriptional regulator, partial [Sphingopyxis terrae]|nr:LysR family transcriptional regulator [Sphingopyxis terrae]
MFDWNDVRTFLAVARGGSTLAAAKTLKVNQTTVSRRLDALDQALGLKLFERSQSGTRLTEAGQALLADAEQLERAAEGLARTAAQHHRGLAGTIRVTTGDVMASIVLTPLLPEFRRLYPEVAIQLAITDAALDLEAGEADVAFRGAFSLEDSNLVARKVNVDDFGLYCSLTYVERHGLPTPETLGAHVLVAGEGPMDNMPGMRWMLAQAPGAEVAVRSSSMANVIQSVRAGLGVGPMPSLIGGR